MKETNINWLGNIPDNWKKIKFFQLFEERSTKVSDKDYMPLSVCKAGIVPQLDTAVKTDNGDNRKLVLIGDYVFNTRSDRKGSSGISSYDGSVSVISLVLKPRREINKQYFHYLLRSHSFIEEFYRLGHGLVADLWTTKFEDIKNEFLPFPDLIIQEKISVFLDKYCAQIDTFVEKKTREIELLEELKTSVITETVLGRLNKNRKLKNSGVQWLGMIPEDWDVKRIKNYFSIRKVIAGQEGYSVFSITQKGLKIKDISKNEGQMAADYSNYQFVFPGDFAMNHMDLLTGYIGINNFELGVTSPDYRVFTLIDKENCYSNYYLHLFEMAYKLRVFYKLGKGAASKGRWRLPKNEFLDMEIPIPKKTEQIEIAALIEKKCSEIETMISNIQKEIDSIKDLHKRIICDAVTGKLTV